MAKGVVKKVKKGRVSGDDVQPFIRQGDRLLKPKEVAQILNLSPSSIYRLFYEDHLKGVKLPGPKGSVRIWASSVESLVKEYGEEAKN